MSPFYSSAIVCFIIGLLCDLGSTLSGSAVLLGAAVAFIVWGWALVAIGFFSS